VIKSPPLDLADDGDRRRLLITFLGKSEKGVYFGASITTITNFKLGSSTIRAAVGETSEWVLMHRSGLKPNTCWGQPKFSQEESRVVRPWILDDYSTKEKRRRRRSSSSTLSQHDGWDSDDDNIIDNAYGVYGAIHFLGFHRIFFFYIFFTSILQNYMVQKKFAKLYIWRSSKT
jgi:hypothetical protein